MSAVTPDLPSWYPAWARELAEEAVCRAREFGTDSAVGSTLRLCATVYDGQRAVDLLEEAGRNIQRTSLLLRTLWSWSASLRVAAGSWVTVTRSTILAIAETALPGSRYLCEHGDQQATRLCHRRQL